ncbi:MAG: excinuclease ABC subunit UvrC [Treponema sp.]
MNERAADIRETLHQYALSAPKTSGVYLWRDEQDTIIYVGKAKSLKNRLSSYFAARKDIKTHILVSKARRLEYIQTDTEYEALLLENNLIKKHKPRYNINLKDGKTYPVVKITNEPYPRLYRTRRIQNDGARYFGPFPNVAALDDFLSLIKRNYPLRQCRHLKKREPCLYFHIGRCSAPCANRISEAAYRKDIDEIALLLDGDFEKPVAALTEKMQEAAAACEFEKAARIRDGIQAVQSLRGQSIVEDMDPAARDYIGWAAEASLITFTVLKMRNGKVVGRDLYRTESLKDETEVLPEFLMAYYTDPKQIPPYIFVPAEQGHELAEQWFFEHFHMTVAITMIPLDDRSQATAAEPAPSYTATLNMTEQNAASLKNLPPSVVRHHRAALAMAQFNAKEDAGRRLKEQGDYPALEELQQLLSLEKLPYRIEGFDIAHVQGTCTVASLISFKDGNPDKKNYRIFRLRTTDGIIDDYASMREAVARRYTRLVNEAESLPDLILIDGGIGQVNAAYTVLTALELSIPLVGLAEKNEELYLPHTSTPIVLPRRSAALRLLQRVRDETHRFANTRTNRMRSKEALHLLFEQLPHIGKKRASKLLHSFSNTEKLAGASAEAVAAAVQLSLAQATEVVAAAKKMVQA